jgi:hypothetical protein
MYRFDPTAEELEASFAVLLLLLELRIESPTIKNFKSTTKKL